MLKRNLPAAIIIALMTTGTMPAMAENQAMSKNFIQMQEKQESLASNLIGEDVMNQKNEIIGDINDLILDDKYEVHAVVIGVGGFLGIGEKDVAVPLSTLNIKKSNDNTVITINASKETLEMAPGYKTTDEMNGGVTKKIQKKLIQVGEKMKDAGESTKEKAKETYEKVKEKAKESMSDSETEKK